MMWHVIHLADLLLWLFMAASVAYVLLFAVASLFTLKKWKRAVQAGAVSTHTFLVLIPAYKEDKVIRATVSNFLAQDYPQDNYRLVVISDRMQADTNQWLAAQPVELLTPTFDKSSKAKALQYAMSQTGGAFDYVVILDADNHVDRDFLSNLSSACSEGHDTIQCHRVAKNDDNEVALLDGVSEEINNTLFRKAHNNVGLSAALIGSGMCFGWQWFRDNVCKLDSAVEDRELEALLLLQGRFVKYEEGILVKDEKVSSGHTFQRQRLRWMTGQMQSFRRMLPNIPRALLTGNIDYIDKTIQQMLIPRSILLTVVPLMAMILTCLNPLWSLKWWGLLAALCAAVYVAIPAPLRTCRLFSKVGALPRLTGYMLKNLLQIDMGNKDFIHTTHDK